MTAETFLQELQKLILKGPKRPVQILNSENCEYGDYIYYGKDLYNCFDCGESNGGIYMFDSHRFTNCADCDFTYESELCYESVDAIKCFNSSFMEYCENMTDSDFCYDCRGGHDMFGCVHLNNKSFCIFNRQFTEEEYREKVKYLKTLPPEKIIEEVNKIKAQHPVTQTRGYDNVNSNFGNYMYNCKDCYLCFDANESENSGYIYDAGWHKFTYDITQSRDCELSYEVIDSGNIFNSDHIVFSKNCRDSSYLFDCVDTKNSLGCIQVNHRQYCILNRQFTKDEYERISAPLLEDLKTKNPGWGDLVF